MLDFKKLWNQAATFEEFVASCQAEHCGLWQGVYRLARVPDWARDAVTQGRPRNLLVIAEGWCGDASNTVPIIAKLVDSVPGLELRILQRDANPDVMNRYLTNGAQSIPVVIVLDESLQEVGHWGPRPTELQAWVMANRGVLPKAELYPQVRKWYARDRGESTLREVLEAAGLGGRGAGRRNGHAESETLP